MYTILRIRYVYSPLIPLILVFLTTGLLEFESMLYQSDFENSRITVSFCSLIDFI